SCRLAEPADSSQPKISGRARSCGGPRAPDRLFSQKGVLRNPAPWDSFDRDQERPLFLLLFLGHSFLLSSSQQSWLSFLEAATRSRLPLLDPPTVSLAKVDPCRSTATNGCATKRSRFLCEKNSGRGKEHKRYIYDSERKVTQNILAYLLKLRSRSLCQIFTDDVSRQLRSD